MRKSLIVLSVLLLSISLMAQVRTGTIWGHVTDTEGAPLPGVSVTMISPFSAPITAITDDQGIFRFPALEPGPNYGLTAELQGFKKQAKTGIIVALGVQSRIDLTMEQGKLEEQVTVVAVTPTVDAKKTSVGKNVTQDILQSLPSSRDPWTVMQMAPSIQVDRENVGGSESGQQSYYYAAGMSQGSNNNVWALDGVVVTDPSAIGSSGIYWDFDSFEELNVVTGGADVTIQTGGVALNMVSKRGGNKVTLGGRFYLTDSAFQANNLTAALEAQGVTNVNKINQIKDYGFNLGGPVIKDKLWLWMSYSVQDINSFTIASVPQKINLTDYNFKLNAQIIPSNKFEAMYTLGNKVFAGRSSTQAFPEGYNQSAPAHWGVPILKLQDEQMIGNALLLAAKFAYMGAGFAMIPISDPNGNILARWDVTNGVGYGWDPDTYGGTYITKRPMYDYDFHGQYYNDKLFGVGHEIKFGVEYSTRRVTTDSFTPGNVLLMYDLNYPDLWWDNAPGSSSGNPGFTPGMTQMELYNDYNLDWSVKQLTAFLQDTVTAGRFNFLLGVRYDRQTPSVNSSFYGTVNNNAVWNMFDPSITAALQAFMPGTAVPNISPDYHWQVWSPRIGITYDLFGTGKTILKLSGSIYGDFMGTGSVTGMFNPYGAGGSYLYFWWLDSNGDGKIQANEIWGNDPATYAPIPLIANGAVNPAWSGITQFIQWGGFTPYSSTITPQTPYTVEPNAGSSRTYELLFTADHELLPDFSVALDATYRKYNHFSWNDAYYANGFLGDYSIDGTNVALGPSAGLPDSTIPSSITDIHGNTVNLGAGPGNTFYLLDSQFTGTPYTIHELMTNYETYWGIDLTFNKRLTNKWMLDGSVTYQDQKYHYGNGYTNASNLWALNDQTYAINMGSGSGKIGQQIFSHWLFKLEGLYQLPMGFNVSFTFNARAGHIIPHYMTIVDYTWANSYSHSVQTYLDVFGNQTLPTFYQLNLRLEKMVKIGETGRIYIMADAFNVTNAAIINRRYDRNEGTYYIYSDHTRFVPYSLYYKVNEILNPLVMRLGVRFQF